MSSSERSGSPRPRPAAPRKGLVRRLVDCVQCSRAWRWIGERWVVHEVRIVAALEDPQERWRHVYPDFGKRADGGRQALGGAWIAVWGRRGLGGTLLHPFQEGLFLSAMRVRPWARRWGIASKLVERAQTVARERKTPIWLVVAGDNEPAIRLYLGYDFQKTDPPKVVSQEGHIGMCWDPHSE